ncbi:MAG: PKD domain-containing protein [Candidatus Bathyarchaeota archaeon]|nr:PKD domain-containing protein [Candidatus Bathyarchaeum tardum]
MINQTLRTAFMGKNYESLEKNKQIKKRMLTSLIILTLISLLVSTPQLIFSASAIGSEPSLEEILNNVGYSNIAIEDVETFPAGIYNITLLAEFAGYYNNNILSYYVVETTNYHTIFTGPEGASGSNNGGYVIPPISKMLEVDSQFGLTLITPEYQYFTEHDLNPDFPLEHAQVFRNLDNPNMFLIGFENYYGQQIARDFNDMVFSLTLINPLEIVSVSRIPETPNYDESVTVTAQVKEGSYEIDSVILSFQANSGSWSNVTMNLDTTEYVAMIPAQQYGKTVNYKVYAIDVFGSTAVSTVYSYTVGDFIEPIIIDVARIPSVVNSHQIATILANVTEPIAGSGVKSVILHYKINNEWTMNAMSLRDGLWTEIIPGQNPGTPVQFYVQAYDGAENNAQSPTFSYQVIIPNSAPRADFSVAPTPGYTDENINFDGSASSDLDGTIANYFWNFGDGTYAYGETTSHAYDKNGEFVVSLRVTDNRGAIDIITKTVTVENRPAPQPTNNRPVAVFTESPEPAYATETVTLNASESYDTDGTITTYTWNFGDGTTATGAIVTHTYENSGSYKIELTVTDNEGATDSTTSTKTILNNEPIAAFTQTSEEANKGEKIVFDASESFDVDGTIVEYTWTFGDQTTSTGVIVDHSYPNTGEYTVTLTVTDDDGATDSVTSTVNVVNQEPVAIFIANTTEITENQAVQFDASESYDTDGTITTYTWNFGDGTTATGITTEHTYTQAGEYTVTLTVTDNEGASTSATTTVNVTAEPTVTLAVLSVIGLGITALTASLLYGLFVRRNKNKKSKKTD